MIVQRCVLALVGLTALTLPFAGCQGPGPVGTVAPASDRVLVVVVPGTYSSANFWPTVQEGKATFGSELLRALPEGSAIMPAIWESSIRHANREEEARDLVEQIDARSAGFDRVCLVGHSHGGNIALLAAGRCQTKIDMVICLSTPHVHLNTKQPGKTLPLPVYCSPETLAKTNTIVTLVATTDNVCDWLNLLPVKGMTEQTAKRLTSDWQDQLGHPRLLRDDIRLRAFALPQWDNLIVAERLNVDTLHFDVVSLVRDENPVAEILEIGAKPHHTLHSRRIGYVLGELIRDGPTAKRIEYLRGLVQPTDADDGEPVDEAVYADWLRRAEPAFSHAGWCLEEASVQLPDGVAGADGSRPSPVLQVRSADGRKLVDQTKAEQETLRPEWKPRIFVYLGSRFMVGLYERQGVSAHSFGARILVADETLPAHVPANPGDGVLWSGDLRWGPMHF